MLCDDHARGFCLPNSSASSPFAPFARLCRSRPELLFLPCRPSPPLPPLPAAAADLDVDLLLLDHHMVWCCVLVWFVCLDLLTVKCTFSQSRVEVLCVQVDGLLNKQRKGPALQLSTPFFCAKSRKWSAQPRYTIVRSATTISSVCVLLTLLPCWLPACELQSVAFKGFVTFWIGCDPAETSLLAKTHREKTRQSGQVHTHKQTELQALQHLEPTTTRKPTTKYVYTQAS